MNARTLKLRNRVLAGASAATLGWAVATAALALPVNPTIFANSPIPGAAATFNPSAGNLTITQNAERVVIDWDSFNIANGETVTFVQPDAQAIAFNRIDPLQFTTIDGNLNANGSVWLFSPGGILFGSNAQVNTASFFAGLGALDDFQANQSVGLSDVSVFVNFGAALNPNTLTVAPGAQIFSGSTGFVVLQAEHLEIAGGQIGGPGSQVGFIVAEGATVDFVASADGWDLLAAHQASDPVGRGEPILHHYADTTAEWIVIESAQFTESDFESVINLDGVMTITGADPTNGDGLHVWGGTDTTADIVNGEITNITASGQFTSVGDVSLDATEVYVTGDIVTSGDFEAFAYSILQVNGDTSIDAGGDVTLHSHGDIADIRIHGDVHADAIVDIWSTAADTLTTVDGNVSAGGQVRIRSGGDLVIRYSANIYGDTDGDGAVNGTGVFIASGAALQTPANTYYLSAGDLTVENGAIIDGGASAGDQQVIFTGNYGTLDIQGDVDASRIVIRANDNITVGGQLTATDEIIIGGGTGAHPGTVGDIVIDGTAVLEANDRILLFNGNDDITVLSGASLQSDADGVPTNAIVPHPFPGDAIVMLTDHHILVESGASLDSGNSFTYFYANGTDSGSTLADAALILDGDIDATAIIGYAYNGSIVISGDLHADVDMSFYAADGFVLTAGGSLTAMYVNAGEFDAYIADDEIAGVLIDAGDIAISGDITAQAIAIRSVNTSNTVLGGTDGPANVGAYELGGEFNLSDAEFQHLDGETILIVSGGDNSDPSPGPDTGMTVRDLTLGEGVANLVLGASSQDHINIVGDLAVQGASTELWVGFVLDNGDFPELTGAIPGQINIDGAIGTATNPFAGVHLLATDSILMGSSDFIGAALGDEDFDAELDGGNLTVNEGQIFIAADVLTMFSAERIVQQNTGAEGEFAGLLIGAPVAGKELISAGEALDGAVVGGSDGYTIDLSTGPVKIQLYGTFLGQSGTVEGRDVALNPYLLSPLTEENVAYEINGCSFGTSSCGKGDEAPHFDTPTDTGMADLTDIEQEQTAADDPASDDSASDDTASKDDEDSTEESASEDQDSKLFRALVAPGADRAYEQERIGEPITGSGNEDLWTGHGAGDKP